MNFKSQKPCLIMLSLFVSMIISCEQDATTPAIETIPLNVSLQITEGGSEWSCPTNTKLIHEGIYTGHPMYLYVKLNKLSKDGDTLKLKIRTYFTQEHNGTPVGWTPYSDIEFWYYKQAMNLHLYSRGIATQFQEYSRVIEVTGTAIAEDGTICDIGTFRMGASEYINIE